MKISNTWIKAFTFWPLVMKRAWPWLLFFGCIDAGIHHFISNFHPPDERIIILVIIISLIFSLFFSAFSSIVINQILDDVKKRRVSSLMGTVTSFISPVLIETTRAIVPILIKSCLLIIPGIIEAIRLWFVAYVVQFDSEYATGKVDALERSRDLVIGRTGAIFGILILNLVLSIVPWIWRSTIEIKTQPLLYFFSMFVLMSCEAYADTVLFLVYEVLENNRLQRKAENHGSSISLP